MLSVILLDIRAEGSADEFFVKPLVEVDVEVAAQRYPNDGIGSSADKLFVEQSGKFNVRVGIGAQGFADEFVESTAKVVRRSCMSFVCAYFSIAAAGKCKTIR